MLLEVVGEDDPLAVVLLDFEVEELLSDALSEALKMKGLVCSCSLVVTFFATIAPEPTIRAASTITIRGANPF